MRILDFVDGFTSATAPTNVSIAATAVSVTPSGNLSSTTVSAALTELQGDIDGLTTLANGKIYIGNGSNVATEVTPSGDVTISNAGVTAIASGVIVNADISSSAAIAHSKMAALSPSRVMVTDGSGAATTSSVTSGDLGYILGLSSTAVGVSSTQALTNKVIDADSNTITNIDNADIKAGANIAHSKMAALTIDRVLVSDGSGIVSTTSVTSGDIGYVAGLASTAVGTTSSQTLSNKTLDNTTAATIKDSSLTIQRSADATKMIQFSVPSTVSGTRTLILPHTDTTIASTDTSQTFSSKTILFNVVTGITTSATVAAATDLELVSTAGGAITRTLPTAVGVAGKRYTIKKTNSGGSVLTIATTSSQTIDGKTSQKMFGQYDWITVMSDGSNWQIVDERISVFAQYSTNAGGSYTSSYGIVDFEDVIEDALSCVTTGASWKFTAPRAGVYEVSALTLFQSAAYTAGQAVSLRLFKNGSAIRSLFYQDMPATTFQAGTPGATSLISLADGDFIDLRLLNGRGATSLETSATVNWVSIKRVF